MRMPALKRSITQRGWSPRLAAATTRALFWTSTLLALLWLAACAAALSGMRLAATRQLDITGANIAAAVEQQLAQDITLVDLALQKLAEGLRDPELPGLNPLRRNEALFAAADVLPNIAFLQALNEDGDVIASRQPEDHASNWANRGYFIEHRRDPALEMRISRPFAIAQPASAGVAFSRRMSNPDGSFAGVVVCGIRLAYVHDIFERLALGKQGAIALFRADGIVLTRLPSDANTIGHSLDPADPLAKAVQTGLAPVTLEDPLDHVRRQFTFRRVGALPLVVAVGLSRDDALPGWWMTAGAILGTGVLLALLTVGMAVRLRQELVRREATDRESVEKGRFLATMSHELRAPLHGMLGYAEQLRLADDLPTPYAERLDAIVNAGRRMREMVDRLLDYWRLEARGPALQMRPIDMPALLEECRAVVEPEARAKSLQLRAITAPGAPQYFVTDGTWLRQVVVNLLANAIKFTSRGSVELRFDGNQDRVSIEVTDTGPGIAPDARHRLFHEYDRLGANDTSVQGSGLGLSIADRLIRLMGGHIGHRDNTGGGSVFWVELPAGVAQEAMAQPAPATSRSLRILVVDDSAVHRDLARAFLAGHSVVEAASGAEAVRLAGTGEFDVILMDMRMPAMSGLEAARKIHALHGPARAVPIIAVTANALDEDIERYRRAGLAEHLSKPFARPELLRSIAAAMKRDQRQPAPAQQVETADDDGAVLLDNAALDAFEAGIGSDRMTLHLATLNDSVAGLLAALCDGEPAAAPGQLAELAHIVAGDAGQLGFIALSQAARRLMAAIEQGGGEVAAAAAALRAIARRSQAVLDQRIGSLRCAFAQAAKLP